MKLNLLGDLFALFLFTLIGSVSPLPGADPLLDLLGTFALFAVLWLIAGFALKAFDPRRRLAGYFGRVIAAWVIAGFAGLIARLLLSGSAFTDVFSLVMIWSEGLVNLLMWRIAYRALAALLASRLRTVTLIGLAAGAAAALAISALRIGVSAQYGAAIYTPETVPDRPAALVLGAGLWFDGTPSTVLRNRVAMAVDLYHAGKVDRLIMSGDGRAPEGDEPAAMRQIALEAGVPDSAILLDPLGVRTYESCARAQSVYGETAITLVTQNFHLLRSLFICDSLGLDAVGVAPVEERTELRALVGWEVREIGATALAWWDVRFAAR
ncbi:MAG: YdcF family protein [Anaerolinea sp.]|nr:YdcF family protein [Anaerolinea sp.]